MLRNLAPAPLLRDLKPEIADWQLTDFFGNLSTCKADIFQHPLKKKEDSNGGLLNLHGKAHRQALATPPLRPRFPGGSVVKDLPTMHETRVRSLGRENPLEKGMATHFSILAWRIPWTEEPGGLQSTGHKESDTTKRLTHTHAHLGDH